MFLLLKRNVWNWQVISFMAHLYVPSMIISAETFPLSLLLQIFYLYSMVSCNKAISWISFITIHFQLIIYLSLIFSCKNNFTLASYQKKVHSKSQCFRAKAPCTRIWQYYSMSNSQIKIVRKYSLFSRFISYFTPTFSLLPNLLLWCLWLLLRFNYN